VINIPASPRTNEEQEYLHQVLDELDREMDRTNKDIKRRQGRGRKKSQLKAGRGDQMISSFFSVSEPSMQCVKTSKDVRCAKDDSMMAKYGVDGEQSRLRGILSKASEEENILPTHAALPSSRFVKKVAFSEHFSRGKKTESKTQHASKETKSTSNNLSLKSASIKRGINDPEHKHTLQLAGDYSKLCNLEGSEVGQISAKKKRRKY
jgi:hypothetical protein